MPQQNFQFYKLEEKVNNVITDFDKNKTYVILLFNRRYHFLGNFREYEPNIGLQAYPPTWKFEYAPRGIYSIADDGNVVFPVTLISEFPTKIEESDEYIAVRTQQISQDETQVLTGKVLRENHTATRRDISLQVYSQVVGKLNYFNVGDVKQEGVFHVDVNGTEIPPPTGGKRKPYRKTYRKPYRKPYRKTYRKSRKNTGR